MYSSNHQAVSRHEDETPDAPFRPEPFVPQRVEQTADTFPFDASNQPRVTPGIREELAAAFGRLGSALDAKAAYERARSFYKSSGHRWTRGLR